MDVSESDHASDGNDTDRERTRSVTGSCPASTPIETHALVRDNLEQATATEGLGVCLTLDLQNIQREQNNFSDTDQAGGSSQPSDVQGFPTMTQFSLTCQQSRA